MVRATGKRCSAISVCTGNDKTLNKKGSCQCDGEFDKKNKQGVQGVCLGTREGGSITWLGQGPVRR